MFRIEKANSSQPDLNSGMPKKQSSSEKHHKKLYVITGGIAVAIIIVAALLIPQGSSSPVQLGLQYTVGNHMVYDISDTVMGQQTGIPVSSPAVDNSTIAIDVLSFDGENYVLNESISTTILNQQLPAITVNVSKSNYYDNFLAPGGPAIFYNASSNPTLENYLAKSQVDIGDVWRMPVNTGNASLGLTGEITLKFSGLQDLTVPAGTYKTIKIDISTDNLTMHYDPAYTQSTHLDLSGNYTLRLTGTTYLEQNTCRLIKSDLTQYGTNTQQSAPNADITTITSTICTEKTLTQES
jgi:hypothetical protein